MPPIPHRKKPAGRDRTRAVPDRAPRNAINYVLDDRQHARVLSELIRLKEIAGMEVKLGAYAKNALLEHHRLRTIEGKVRELWRQANTASPKDDDFPNARLATLLNDILNTPVAG